MGKAERFVCVEGAVVSIDADHTMLIIAPPIGDPASFAPRFVAEER